MLHLRIYAAADTTEAAVEILTADPAVSGLAVLRGASIVPPGDVLLADDAREATNDVIDRLLELGVQRGGTIHIEPVHTWISQSGFAAERLAPAAAPTQWSGPMSSNAPTTTPS